MAPPRLSHCGVCGERKVEYQTGKKLRCQPCAAKRVASYRDRQLALGRNVCAEESARRKQSGYYKNPDHYAALRRNRLRREYGMTVEQYDAMFDAQGGVCKICGEPPNWKRSQWLVVDHCHKRGVVRGLLCSRCNVAIGMLRESIPNFLKAARYIKEN